MTATGPSILVLLGTDHHRFDRLVAWADAWMDDHPGHSVTVQHGSSIAPRTATGIAFLAPEEMRTEAGLADIVITHGGPGTITDARSAGHRPLTVPRDPALGEHVDGHQLSFAPWAQARGLVTCCLSAPDLSRAVTDALRANGGTRTAERHGDSSAATSARLERLLLRTAPTASSPEAPLVLYIGGAGRSGSTLVERLLGEMPDVVPLGEVNHLWRRGVVGDELCACGRAFGACEFWQRVGDRAFGGWANVDTERLFGLKDAVDRQRRIPQTSLRHTSRAMRRLLLEYTGYFRAVYRSVQELTGARIIIDSSKHPSLALALSHDRHIDLRVMHLTRDSRGVAYSWSKVVARPEATGGDAYMPRLSPLQSTLTWTSHNLTIEGLRHRGVPVSRVQYERLVASPATEIAQLWRELSLPGSAEVPLRDDNTIELSPTHSVAGNPMRFRSGTTTIRPDDGWRTDLDRSERRAVTALSLPVLYWLGYRQRVAGPAPAAARAPDAAAYLPSVSVVIATRDRPQLLREAIAAVRSQDYPGTIETIVVYDQQEPDHAVEESGNRPVRVTANDHKPGLAGARNSGIAAAAGEVVAFCDDDDYWLPGKLTAQVARLADPGVDFVSCGIRVRYDGTDHDRLLAGDQVTFRDLLRDRHTELHPSTFVVRRSALDARIGPVDENVPGGFGEDYEFLLRAARSAPIANVAAVHTVVRWGSQSYFFRRWQTMRDGLTWLLAQYPEFDDVPSGSARIRSQIAFAQASLGERHSALASAGAAFRRNPLEPRTYLAVAVGLGLVSPDRVMTALHRLGRGI